MSTQRTQAPESVETAHTQAAVLDSLENNIGHDLPKSDISDLSALSLKLAVTPSSTDRQQRACAGLTNDNDR